MIHKKRGGRRFAVTCGGSGESPWGPRTRSWCPDCRGCPRPRRLSSSLGRRRSGKAGKAGAKQNARVFSAPEKKSEAFQQPPPTRLASLTCNRVFVYIRHHREQGTNRGPCSLGSSPTVANSHSTLQFAGQDQSPAQSSPWLASLSHLPMYFFLAPAASAASICTSSFGPAAM